MKLKPGDSLHIYTENGKIKLKLNMKDSPFENIINLQDADLLFQVDEETTFL